MISKHLQPLASIAGRAVPLGLVLLTAAPLLSGCGGSTGTSGTAQERAVNACPNGGTATIEIGGATSNGNQDFLQTGYYLPVNSGTATFTFTLSTNTNITYPGITPTLSPGTYYSIILFGRADITSYTDARYPKLQSVVDDKTEPPTGEARLRIIQAAPDATPVDVLIGGQVVASNVAYGTVGSYLNVTAGNQPVQINLAGTSTALVPAQTLTLTAGKIYSLFAVEPTVTPTPAYGEQLVDDTV